MSTDRPDAERHPEEGLSSYVDGTLDGAERKAVEEHLSSCPRCRDEVRRAASAREALRALPLIDGPPEEARRRARRIGVGGERWSSAPRGRRSTAPRWAAAAAVAAVIVGVAAVIVPHLPGRSASSGAPAAAARASEGVPRPSASGAAPVVERQALDYDAQAVAALAAGVARGGAADAGVRQRAAYRRPPQDPSAAIACVDRWAGATRRASPIRIIEASYEHTPAYLGVARQAAAPGQPERILVWVLAQRGCRLISFTQRGA